MKMNVWIKVLAAAALSCGTTLVIAQDREERSAKATLAEVGLAFKDIPDLAKAIVIEDPTGIGGGSNVFAGTLDLDDRSRDRLADLAREIGDAKHGKFDSLLVVHKNKLVFESYYLRGRIDLPHPQASATKAYTGLAIGRAIELGYLTMSDLDKPLIGFLNDLDPSKFVPGADKITLHKAMTMRSGIRISKDKKEELNGNHTLVKGQKHVQAYLEHSEPITKQSQSFLYQDDPRLVMQVLEAVVPGTAKEFIERELLDKLGITNFEWKTDINGLPQSGSRTSMTSRDMVKWGTLVRNKGRWGGKQLVSEAFITKAIDRIVYTGDEDVHFGGPDVTKQGYGYFWWGTDLNFNNTDYSSVSAQGGWGQLITLVDELDLMVVITGHDNDTPYLQIVAERVLPVFIQ
ncbi:serine hydrolase [Arenicella sp. 4NH20-0111]|uniref:serine hydrolase domain-containing protein n=1 Tax=Arenicella sp. 4NH20-0111 TaxID=3127648 RepID=UPI003107A0C9